jgi:hypothetical protein
MVPFRDDTRQLDFFSTCLVCQWEQFLKGGNEIMKL